MTTFRKLPTQAPKARIISDQYKTQGDQYALIRSSARYKWATCPIVEYP